MADSSVRTPNGFLVFLGSSVVLTAAIIIVGGIIARAPKVETVDAKRAQQRVAAREKLEATDKESLTAASWLDKEKGIVRLPIDHAISLVAKELAGKKPAPSQVKVDPPLPMPPPYDPNSKEPSISALPSAPQGAVTIRFEAPASAAPAPAAPAAAPSAPAPAPAPAAPPAASVVPAADQVAVVATDRPPLIHFTENTEPKK